MEKKHGRSSFIIYRDSLNVVLHFQEFVRELIEKKMLEGDHSVSPDTDFPMTPFGYLDDQWDVYEEGNRIFGSTVMDNFDMMAYFNHIGIPQDAVIWRDY